jgi:hypothetical protein
MHVPRLLERPSDDLQDKDAWNRVHEIFIDQRCITSIWQIIQNMQIKTLLYIYRQLMHHLLPQDAAIAAVAASCGSKW